MLIDNINRSQQFQACRSCARILWIGIEMLNMVEKIRMGVRSQDPHPSDADQLYDPKNKQCFTY